MYYDWIFGLRMFSDNVDVFLLPTGTLIFSLRLTLKILGNVIRVGHGSETRFTQSCQALYMWHVTFCQFTREWMKLLVLGISNWFWQFA